MLQVHLCWFKVFLSTVQLSYYRLYLLSLTMNLGHPAIFSLNMVAKPIWREYCYIFVSWTVHRLYKHYQTKECNVKISPSSLFALAATCSEAPWALFCLTPSLWFVLNTFSPSEVADSAAYLIFEAWKDCHKSLKWFSCLRKYWNHFPFLSVQENEKLIPGTAEQYVWVFHFSIFKSYLKTLHCIFKLRSFINVLI